MGLTSMSPGFVPGPGMVTAADRQIMTTGATDRPAMTTTAADWEPMPLTAHDYQP